MKRRWLRIVLGTLVAGLLVGGPLAYFWHQEAQARNFRVVEPGKLYRSGQMSPEAFLNIVKEYRIKTVISLRYSENPNDRPPDWREQEFCETNGIRHIRIRPRVWHENDDGVIPADEPVREFIETMKNPDIYPVLLHCFAGKHRTGAFCSIYRMEFQHWSNEDAIRELRALGYVTLDEDKDVLAYLASYVPHGPRPRTPAVAPSRDRAALVNPADDGRMEK